MNVHDSQKIANLLHHHGYTAAEGPDDADLTILNTCSIRDKAEHRLYSELGALRKWKSEREGRVIGVGGCVAQQQGDALLRRFDQLDFVFGTHNLRWVGLLADAAGRGERTVRTQASRSLERFDLPGPHPDQPAGTPGRAYVTVMEGCDLFCSFCIVPQTRGREVSRPAEEIVRESEALAAQGVREITLLGQTVNAYGRHDARRGVGDRAGTIPFAALLRRLAGIPGLSRLRYTSPHPIFFDDALIAAHGDLPALCPHVHLPLQSGSDAMLRRMRRRYSADAYRSLVQRLRRVRPDIALTTDLIVGAPGESDADFRATLDLVREVGFVDGFSFKYSPRPGTAAALDSDTVGPAEAQARLEELQSLQRGLTLAAHRARVGEVTEVLAEGESRRAGNQRTGRDPYHRVVNFADTADPPTAAGSLLLLELVEATPHSLIGQAPDPQTSVRAGRTLKGRSSRADEHWRNAGPSA
jgi:tRNA-2-methylthio-N6-dimethylallyladenosine synthase